MFDGFELTRREGNGARLRVRHGGSGPAVLLLHGHPRTHVTWHRVAPLLAAAGRRVVRPDLRGYGRSDKPPTATSTIRPTSNRDFKAVVGCTPTELVAHRAHPLRPVDRLAGQPTSALLARA